jgi:4-hydroxy-2-oxoheptanedioate aldolase
MGTGIVILQRMQMPKNQFKAALRAHKRQIGLWVGLADSVSAEICAGAGFDWLLIDGEHAPNDVRTLLAQLQAVAAYPAHPVLRPLTGDTHLIKQLLDIGAQTLLIPMVESAAQAKELVAAVRYPPAGIRGIGTTLARAARWDRIPDYLHQANAEVCLLVQVETRKGLENLEAIAAVEGVDGVFIGPSDLSASLGHTGQIAHPEMLTVIEDAIRRIVAAGKAAGILTTDDALARRHLELGCSFVAVGIDTALLKRATDDLVRQFKEA